MLSCRQAGHAKPANPLGHKMKRTWTILGVVDVAKSFSWYQALFTCCSRTRSGCARGSCAQARIGKPLGTRDSDDDHRYRRPSRGTDPHELLGYLQRREAGLL